jgi:predicted unusual protein kinase regulating ubiquinone biosynthesis (AarF/ABC1/UbiB family)
VVFKMNLIPMVIGVGEGDERAVVDRAEALGRPLTSYDRKGFERDVGELLGLARDTHLRKVQLGRLMMGVASMAVERGLRPPPELALVGKTLLNLDGIAAALAPDFDPNEAVKRHTLHLTQHRLLGAATPGTAASALLEAKDFVQELPGRLGRVLDAVARSDLEVRVRVVDDAHILTALHQLANRLTTGLVLAAVIVGAAIMMNIETRLRLFGYPLLALVFFLAAACGVFALLVNIWRGDRKTRQEAREK